MEDVEIDLSVRAVRRGDLFLLCSDGLSNFIETEELGQWCSTTAHKMRHVS